MPPKQNPQYRPKSRSPESESSPESTPRAEYESDSSDYEGAEGESDRDLDPFQEQVREWGTDPNEKAEPWQSSSTVPRRRMLRYRSRSERWWLEEEVPSSMTPERFAEWQRILNSIPFLWYNRPPRDGSRRYLSQAERNQGVELRNLPTLPDFIPPRVPAIVLSAFKWSDGRVAWDDIIRRMGHQETGNALFKMTNKHNMRCGRLRAALGVRAPNAKPKSGTRKPNTGSRPQPTSSSQQRRSRSREITDWEDTDIPLSGRAAAEIQLLQGNILQTPRDRQYNQSQGTQGLGRTSAQERSFILYSGPQDGRKRVGKESPKAAPEQSSQPAVSPRKPSHHAETGNMDESDEEEGGKVSTEGEEEEDGKDSDKNDDGGGVSQNLTGRNPSGELGAEYSDTSSEDLEVPEGINVDPVAHQTHLRLQPAMRYFRHLTGGDVPFTLRHEPYWVHYVRFEESLRNWCRAQGGDPSIALAEMSEAAARGHEAMGYHREADEQRARARAMSLGYPPPARRPPH
ncbi:MAG: hypothetical protein M1837_005660 [Sclerophora amabilis]|nr:MAG: hypothetical protein M1837_005660 [Sclerophora amabilis]